jgi:hypothetical protein
VKRFTVLVCVAACRPDLGPPASLVDGARFLAIRAEPPEAPPGAAFHLDALFVDGSGSGISWNLCTTPRPIADDEVAAGDCIFGSDGAIPGRGASIDTAVPTDACQIFGPDVPPPMPGEPPLRPPDPDVTGGYYQPVRALVEDPAMAHHALEAFALERISCNLANAPADIAADFAKRYHANHNPSIARVLVSTDGVTANDLPATIAAGSTVTIIARWAGDSVESYPVYDPVTHALVDHTETLRASWFADAGELAHEATGQIVDGETRDDLTAPGTSGTVHLWIVLRDDRGGADFRAVDLEIQ